MTTGQSNFEIYKINTNKQTWNKVDYDRPIVQTLGSRPIYKIDPNTGNFKLFFFSG